MTLLLTLITLSLLIFVHELGHFLIAKRVGIRVLEFGFGLPPRLFGKKIGETIYSLNLLPIGGFVRLFGEDEADYSPERSSVKQREALAKRAFYAQSKRVRVMVVIAGVVMNFLLGVVLFSGLYSVIGIPTLNPQTVQIAGIYKDSPAESTFQLGDEVLSVAGIPVSSVDEFKTQVERRKGESVSFAVLRAGETQTFSAVPRREPPVIVGSPMLRLSDGQRRFVCVSVTEQQGPLGVVISPKAEMIRYPIWQMPFRGAWFGLHEAFGWGMTILRGLGGILAQLACGSVPKDVGSIVEVGYQLREAAKLGLRTLVLMVGVLSINLAIINLLPIPALDGGRLLFIALETVLGRRVNAQIERVVNSIGFAFLILLVILISVQDVLRRTGEDSLGALLRRVSSL